MKPRFKASPETRLSALRVRIMLMNHQDPEYTANLLHRVERLGTRTGARGLVRVSHLLWEAVRGTMQPSASA